LFALKSNERFDRWQLTQRGWKVSPSRSEVLMTADTPPAQIAEAD
jgi:hypothetical protein